MQIGSMQRVRRWPWLSTFLVSMVAATGAWLIHVVLILCGKICIDTIPGMTQQISWTLVNLMYLAVRHLPFVSAPEHPV